MLANSFDRSILSRYTWRLKIEHLWENLQIIMDTGIHQEAVKVTHTNISDRNEVESINKFKQFWITSSDMVII